MGCLGYVSPSLLHCLESLGIPSSTSRKLRKECSRVALGAVTFFFSEESVLNGSPGLWVNPSALLHSSHTEPLTRPVCCVFFVLCPILPMDLGPQRCSRYRFTQPVRRRFTFGPSEGSACTSRPWVVMTTQIRTVPVCACVLEFPCPVVRMLTLQVCACVFHQFRTTHHGLLVCGVRHCVSDRFEGRCLLKLLCCLFVDSWLLDFSACQVRCPDILNLLTR